MSKCPRCNSPAKLTGKEWEYGLFHVKQYVCGGCEKMFMEYYKGDKLSHTIPKDGKPQVRTSQKIMSYLKRNEVVSEEQIAKDLQLDIGKVERVLSKMEKAGKVEKIVVKELN